ncbi:aminotransferase [Aestuariivirga litoralis]|uniref:aminotransferase n=1 Tax=Aestuariivirga litoralis TaxID=2650924 RepID=UPI0018C726F1|nr:aminotransferase [Aestuariivirga litoralis]MBG1231680.1 aminotransferase [Aestuariivirga litoralis]
MVVTVSPRLSSVEFPPIAEALSWVNGRQSNRELLNLCQAVPSYPPAETLQDEFARLVHLPGMGGYTEILGITELREAFASHLASSYAARVASKDVGITTGCNQAFAAAVMAIAEPGDNIIMPAPYYFNHQMWLGMLGVAITPISAFSPGGAWPSAADAKAAITPKTRAIMLCTPNNPSGAIYPASVLKEFYDVAREADIALIIDETYKDFRPDATPAHALLNEPDWRDRLIQLFSFSKIYALAGYRLGAMVAGAEVMHQATKVLDTMTICPPQVSQRGVLFALKELDEWKQGKKALMAERLAAMRAAFTKPGLKYELISSGAYFAYVKHPFEGEGSRVVAKRLAQEHDVLCLPGAMFGEGQEDYLRFAFANVDKDKMSLLAERLIESQGA